MTGRIFINYRREDSAVAAQALYTQLAEHFGIGNLFMDANSIKPGAAWSDRIRLALEASDAMICLIGENWLRIDDDYGRRRLDLENDWVRQEIEHALGRGIRIYPLLLNDTPQFPPEALPPSIAALPIQQSWWLTRDKWMSDLRTFVGQLEQDGIIVVRPAGIDRPLFPDPDKAKLPPLTEQELSAALGRLDGWEPWTERILREYPLERRELRRSISFKSFRSAMDFMAEAAEIFIRRKHHPRWGNEWKMVSIRLTTWDARNQITTKDVETALEIDRLVDGYKAAKKVLG